MPRIGIPALALLACVGACAHPGGPLSPAALHMSTEASALPAPTVEEDFAEQRLLYQALPVGAPDRVAFRSRLLSYLLEPLKHVNPDDLRLLASGPLGTDDFDRALASFRDALELYDPSELWSKAGPALSAIDRVQVIQAARLILDLYSRRGSEGDVLLAVSVLATLEPATPEWTQRLDSILGWIDQGDDLGPEGQSGLQPPSTPRALLESACASWPAPVVVERLAGLMLKRQEQLAALLRRPLGGGARKGMFGDFLADDGEGLPALGTGLAAVYLRAGQVARASAALATLAGKPGDDPDLRALVDAAAGNKSGGSDFLALARRFLPKVDVLGGTAPGRIDPLAAARVAQLGLVKAPGNADLLVLASRVARLTGAPLLALRYLQEAEPSLAKAGGTADERESQKKELLDLALTRFKVRMDPENPIPGAHEAETLRALFADTRRQLGSQPAWLNDNLIDLELARNYLDAGQPEKAQPIFEHAQQAQVDGSMAIEVTLQLSGLLVKRGEAARAAQLLTLALDNHKPDGPQETIGFVEAHAKLARALGSAEDTAGHPEAAKKAWRESAHAWERLMVEHLRRKNMSESAEAFVEVGRLYYVLGRRTEGIQKFAEAIEQSEGRDQSYIDPLAFLVQHGELDAAVDIFHRAMARPSRVVSEYVKTYAALWIVDLSRRSGRSPDPAADGFLRALDARKIQLRPSRAAAWYVPLAGFAIGRRTFAQLAPMANTPGRQAELYFYEAMRRLADGQSGAAHDLWTKVIETKMVSFFEFEMAARYLRVGAPAQPPPSESDESGSQETI